MSLDALTGQFIVLTTFRRDGTPVPTTVWCARSADGIVVPTGSTTGKVKRIRNNPQVTMVKSSFRGKVKSDVVVFGTARFLEGADVEVARALLADKYGLQWRFTGNNADTFIGITPDGT